MADKLVKSTSYIEHHWEFSGKLFKSCDSEYNFTIIQNVCKHNNAKKLLRYLFASLLGPFVIFYDRIFERKSRYFTV